MKDIPAVPIRMPVRPDIRPFSIAPRLSTDTISTPNSAMAAISGKENRTSIGRRNGMVIKRTTAPTTPPMAETA